MIAAMYELRVTQTLVSAFSPKEIFASCRIGIICSVIPERVGCHGPRPRQRGAVDPADASETGSKVPVVRASRMTSSDRRLSTDRKSAHVNWNHRQAETSHETQHLRPVRQSGTRSKGRGGRNYHILRENSDPGLDTVSACNILPHSTRILAFYALRSGRIPRSRLYSR